MGELDGRTILVTGAGGGNGRAISIGLAAEGASVIAADINEDAAKETAELASGPGSVTPERLDVRDEAAIVDLFGRVGPVDGLVNNAGILTRHRFVEMPIEAFDDLIAINLRGYVICAREAAKQMVPKGSGAIVNICSTNAHHGTPLLVHYGAAKGGVLNLTRALAAELGPDGVRVNSVSPGVIPTGLNSDRLSDPEQVSLSEENIPLGHLGKAEDLVGIVELLLSDRSSWITGADLLVDGGELAG
jgi:NAD(P)-dependent dehydrogenase (short-subunit alcohol dehydrogenase family)